jgi:nucleoside-diphosphate-sugar epimerase
MKRVLITGSSGEIGSALVRALASDPQIERVVGVDVRQPNKFHGDHFLFIPRDVREPLDVRSSPSTTPRCNVQSTWKGRAPWCRAPPGQTWRASFN